MCARSKYGDQDDDTMNRLTFVTCQNFYPTLICQKFTVKNKVNHNINNADVGACFKVFNYDFMELVMYNYQQVILYTKKQGQSEAAFI